MDDKAVNLLVELLESINSKLDRMGKAEAELALYEIRKTLKGIDGAQSNIANKIDRLEGRFIALRSEIHGLRGEVLGGKKELLESFDRLENTVMRAIRVLEEKMDQIQEL